MKSFTKYHDQSLRFQCLIPSQHEKQQQQQQQQQHSN